MWFFMEGEEKEDGALEVCFFLSMSLTLLSC